MNERTEAMRTMRTTRTSCLLVLTAMVLSTLALVALPVSPAAANHVPAPGGPVVGTGTVAGTELLEQQGFTGAACFAATKHIFGWHGQGTFSGQTPGGADVVYRAGLTAGQPLHQGPL